TRVVVDTLDAEGIEPVASAVNTLRERAAAHRTDLDARGTRPVDIAVLEAVGSAVTTTPPTAVTNSVVADRWPLLRYRLLADVADAIEATGARHGRVEEIASLARALERAGRAAAHLDG